MQKLLPSVADRADFSRARQLPVDDWRPALQAIAARHGFSCEPLERFSSGCTPVFGVGRRYVVKLVPRHLAHVVQREAECLKYLADQTNLPVARLVAEGTLEDWHYAVSSRLPGEQLDKVWPRLMALTLIHPMADLPECLALVKGAVECPTWEAVAKIFWPGFDCG